MKNLFSYTLMFLLALPVLNISSLNAQSLDEIIVTAQKKRRVNSRYTYFHGSFWIRGFGTNGSC